LAVAAVLVASPPEGTAVAEGSPLLSLPENISPPATRGPAQVGWTLTALSGQWSGTPPITFSYNWARCWPSFPVCSKISDATSDHYRIGPADEGAQIKVLVTASNPDGIGTALSLQTTPIMPASPPTLEGTSVGTATDATSLTLARPMGSLAGDVLVASLAVGVRGAVAIVPPQNWTLARRDSDPGGGAPLSQPTYWRVVSPIEPGSYSWSWTSSPPVEAAGGILLYRGATTATAIEAASGRFTANENAFAAPSVTTSRPNQLVVGFFGSSGTAGLTPTTMDELFDEAAIGTESGAELEGAATVMADPGPAGDRWVKDSSGTENSSNIGQLVGVRAAAALTAALPPRLPASTGQTYYVAPEGSDGNPGTLEAPWRTIQHALDTLHPGQGVVVRGGTHI
jgi:hypothetical protein